jgi:hypothetical protein
MKRRTTEQMEHYVAGFTAACNVVRAQYEKGKTLDETLAMVDAAEHGVRSALIAKVKLDAR